MHASTDHNCSSRLGLPLTISTLMLPGITIHSTPYVQGNSATPLWFFPCRSSASHGIGANITAVGRKLKLFSAIQLSRCSLKMSSFLWVFRAGKKCTLFSVKWNSDDLATSFQCSAKLIRSAKCCVFCHCRVGPGITISRAIVVRAKSV